MTSKPVAFLLADLGVTKSHSRPRVSNDNPYSESHFKTMKYRPETPRRFASVGHVCGAFGDLFGWYNHEHRHSGIGLMTPYAVHHGMAPRITAARQQTLLAAYARHPDRFVRKPPQPPILPEAAWINPPAKNTTPQDDPGSTQGTSDMVWVPPDPTVHTSSTSMPVAELVQ